VQAIATEPGSLVTIFQDMRVFLLPHIELTRKLGVEVN